MSTTSASTSVQVTPSELETLLSVAFANRKPVLIPGAPGIGKTDIVHRAAMLAGADMIISHPAVSDPTDFKGLPWADAGADFATFLPFAELKRAMQATKLTVWFFDDLGQAPASVQAAAMQLFLARRINGHVLPDCVVFVAATNRRIDKAGVTGILEPVKSRFDTILELVVDVDEWCSWAINSGEIPAEVIAFIRFRPELLSKFEPSADLTNSPMPRTWHKAATWISKGLPAALELKAIAGAVGMGAAIEFNAFRDMLKQMPNIDGILINPDTAVVPDEPSVLYAVTTALAMKATHQNFGRIARYAERLMHADHGEYAALVITDATRKDPTLMQTADFNKIAASELGKLMTGAN